MTNSKGGSFLSGRNPFVFDLGDPLALFIVQLVVILCFCRLIKLILRPLNQPNVISEIITGIILGPSVFGRIPNYMSTLFPKESIPFLSLVSNIGLVFFLFLVGLELDPIMLKKSARRSLCISFAGMALPFGVGAAVSYGLYKLVEENHSIPYSTYMVFIGVAMSITAFPVLARILTELKILKTFVGNTVICAAAIDDCASWCLLALVVSLINSSTGIQALYVFLMGLGYAAFLIVAFRPMFIFFLRKTGSLDNGPSPFVVCVVFILVFVSAFITDAIGIDAIFGGFLAGVVMPHDNGFAFKIIEKIEDLITVLFLPIYFTISGLKTQVGALNDGLSWGMLILVIFVACVGKILGCTIAAKLSKMSWTESLTVGVLMNCKGLVELIVLNIGHDAKVISDKTFAIFVIMALVTTFVTTPLASCLYCKTSEGKLNRSKDVENETKTEQTKNNKYSILTCLDRMEHLSSTVNIIDLLTNDIVCLKDSIDSCRRESVCINFIRFIQITNRISSITRYAETDEERLTDPIFNLIRTYFSTRNVESYNLVNFSSINDYCAVLKKIAEDSHIDLLTIPWVDCMKNRQGKQKLTYGNDDYYKNSPKYTQFVRQVFQEINTNIAVFIERNLEVKVENTLNKNETLGLEKLKNNKNNIFVPFFGGADDRQAVELGIRIAKKLGTKVEIVHYKFNKNHIEDNKKMCEKLATESIDPSYNIKANQETVFNRNSTIESSNSNVLDQRFLEACVHKCEFVDYDEVESNSPLSACLKQIESLKVTRIIISGRARSNGAEELYGENVTPLRSQRKLVLGDVAENILLSDTNINLIVVRSKI